MWRYEKMAKKKKIKKKPGINTTPNRAKKPRYVVQQPTPPKPRAPKKIKMPKPPKQQYFGPGSRRLRKPERLAAIREEKYSKIGGGTQREVKSRLKPHMTLEQRKAEYMSRIYIPQFFERMRELYQEDWDPEWEENLRIRMEHLGMDSKVLEVMLKDLGLMEAVYESGDFYELDIFNEEGQILWTAKDIYTKLMEA